MIMKRGVFDLLSVDLGWSEIRSRRKGLKKVALSFLNFKNKEIYCIYRTHLNIQDFLSILKNNLKIKATVLVDIPLKGKPKGFFRPAERAMQCVGIPCRPSKDALVMGRKLLSKIEPLGYKVVEIYPFEFYKFFSLLPPEELISSKDSYIDPMVFKKSFPPYKRAGERGLKNVKKVVMGLLDIMGLRIINNYESEFIKNRMIWDIYDSLFGAIAGYLLFKHSPWIKFIRDRTGTEILLLLDDNLKCLVDLHISKPDMKTSF